MKPIPTTLIISFSDLTHKHRQTLMKHTNRHKFTNLYITNPRKKVLKNKKSFLFSTFTFESLSAHTRFRPLLSLFDYSITTLQNQPSSALSYFSLLFFLRLWRKLKKDSKVSSSLHRLELARIQEQNRFSDNSGKFLSLGLITYIIHRCLWQFFPT